MNLGRDKLDWSQDAWQHIDQAVHDEAQRTRVAMKFIPIFMTTSDAKTVPSDTIETTTVTTATIGPLSVDEGLQTPVFEISVGFALTKQQVAEMDVSTAVTLATRATNILMQAEDILVFQGDNGLKASPLFSSGRVLHRNNSFGTGLVQAAATTVNVTPVTVDPKPILNKYGENTFGAVATAYSTLQGLGHYGPYALVLHTNAYADTYAPLVSTLIMPADRIKPIVTAGFYGTGTLEPFTGLLMSLGGNSMDLAVGMDATTAFLQPDASRLDQFSVFERFTLRLKDNTAIVKLNFLLKK